MILDIYWEYFDMFNKLVLSFGNNDKIDTSGHESY